MGAGGGAPAAEGGSPGSPGGGADAQRAQLTAFMGKLRELDQHVDTVYAEMPSLAPIAKQVKALIKKSVQDATKTAPAQNASSEAVPTASQ